MNKKMAAFGVCIVLLLTSVIFAGCGGEKKQADVIKIGADLEMTGGNATFGQSAANGAKLAIKEVNAKGGVLGKQLTLIVADNKSEAAEAANAMQKLVTQDKVVAVIAPIASSSVMATVTPLPAASPSALMTMGAPSASI